MPFLTTQAVGLAGSIIGRLLQIKPSRSFSEFSDFCSITETHNLSVTATQFPIEDGTQGTDHIVKDPKNITWDLAFGERSNPQETFDRLLDLMYSGIPFTASTGLKTYENMVLLSVNASQDNHTGRILSCSLTMQEIIITAPVSTTLPPRQNQANANVTGSTSKTGTKQLQPAKPVETSRIENIKVSLFG